MALMCTHTTLWQRIVARIYDPFLWLGERRGMARHRRDLLAHAEGRVLEIGAGTGLNLRHYPDSIEALVLTEPVEPMACALERRVERLGRSARVHRAPAEALPFADDSFDTVVSTLVLCTVEDPVPAAERDRTRPAAGRAAAVHRAPAVGHRAVGALARSARATVGLLRCGCRCNRRTLELIAQSPLTRRESARASWRGMPPLVRPLTIGSATA